MTNVHVAHPPTVFVVLLKVSTGLTFAPRLVGLFLSGLLKVGFCETAGLYCSPVAKAGYCTTSLPIQGASLQRDCIKAYILKKKTNQTNA